MLTRACTFLCIEYFTYEFNLNLILRKISTKNMTMKIFKSSTLYGLARASIINSQIILHTQNEEIKVARERNDTKLKIRKLNFQHIRYAYSAA